MSYRIRLLETDEGWSVSCLDLPGCHSPIELWLEVEVEEDGVKTAEAVEITV